MSSILKTIMITRHPFKRKRRSKNNATLHEGNNEAIDTVTHLEVEANTKHGPKTKCIKASLTAVREEQAPSSSGIHDNPDPVPDYDMEEPQVANQTWPHISMVSF
jgi:hypothetical protein